MDEQKPEIGRIPPKILITPEQIRARVRKLGLNITTDYLECTGNDPLVILCVLKGAVIFMADLLRNLSVAVRVECITAQSYTGTRRGDVKVELVDPSIILRDRHVLVVEDIVDTGATWSTVRQLIENRGAKTVRICSLLSKPVKLKQPVAVDYVGFEIGDVFVVGYGLDYLERYRNLSGIYGL
tara:strand:+ start:407 stop:955 length:549 start_codon:yes stop_codon:yes gene_type:complete